MDELVQAVERGVAALVRAQEPDGRFVDFNLPPGPSDGWMTGFVAVALADALAVAPSAVGSVALARAAGALAAMARPGGWGYNGRTANDGDSTSFAVRALVRAGRPLPAPAPDLLGPYVDGAGAAHTYSDPSRMGGWAGAHADVTPSVGLALLEAGAPPPAPMVAASLAARGADGLWQGYWWRRPCYATWLNLEWLQAAGALTPALALEARDGLGKLTGDLSVLDVACMLGVLGEGARFYPEPALQPLAAYLMQLQQPDGLWPPSCSLLLPPQWGGDATGESPCYADVRALFTTASAVRALAGVCLTLPEGR